MSGSSGPSRAWKYKGRGSSRMMSGGSRGTATRMSVTKRSLRRGTQKATSQNAPVSVSLPIGPNTRCRNSSPQGMGSLVSSRGSSRTLSMGKPRKANGRLKGTAYCPGATQTSASGKRCANGPANVLCSTATVPSTRNRTSPYSASSSRNSSMHSSVGATAPYKSSPPDSSRTAVMRIGTCTYKRPIFCSKPQISPGTYSKRSVRLRS
mmetsp:Transcript_87645/g.246194  ORF Transcript_87645/g.246194 Transcript_87645/m.246194 type:complete len:208 (-) Transcript_87645:351-974(-)